MFWILGGGKLRGGSHSSPPGPFYQTPRPSSSSWYDSRHPASTTVEGNGRQVPPLGGINENQALGPAFLPVKLMYYISISSSDFATWFTNVPGVFIMSIVSSHTSRMIPALAQAYKHFKIHAPIYSWSWVRIKILRRRVALE